MEDYVSYLRTNGDELPALFHDMFIGVTKFFRAPGMFSALRKTPIDMALEIVTFSDALLGIHS